MIAVAAASLSTGVPLLSIRVERGASANGRLQAVAERLDPIIEHDHFSVKFRQAREGGGEPGGGCRPLII